jgi:hypothetical protein
MGRQWKGGGQMTDTKPPVRSEAQVEALVIAALRRLNGIATSHQIWMLVDAAFDVSFETRRNVLGSLVSRGQVEYQEFRDNKLPEPLVKMYRLPRPAPVGRSHQ